MHVDNDKVGRVTQAKRESGHYFPYNIGMFCFCHANDLFTLEHVQFQEYGSSIPLWVDNKATYPQTTARNLQNRGILAGKPIHLGREKS